jgi:ankyrin repeat protein
MSKHFGSINCQRNAHREWRRNIFFSALTKKDMCEYFLMGDVHVNATNQDGQTALHLAAEKNSTDVANFLLDNGAILDVVDQHGQTALHSAAKHDACDVAQILLGHSNKIKEQMARNHLKKDAEFLKEEGPREKFVKKFIENTDNSNSTALHTAVYNNSANVVNLLMSQGANVNAADKNGLTALHVATALKHTNIQKLLMLNGAGFTSDNAYGKTEIHMMALEQTIGVPELHKAVARNLKDIVEKILSKIFSLSTAHLCLDSNNAELSRNCKTPTRQNFKFQQHDRRSKVFRKRSYKWTKQTRRDAFVLGCS